MSNIAEAELKTALATITRAETDIKGWMDAAGIRGASANIYAGQYGPTVSLQSSQRIFLNHDGRRNLQSISVLYRSARKTIDEIGKWLAPHAYKAST